MSNAGKAFIDIPPPLGTNPWVSRGDCRPLAPTTLFDDLPGKPGLRDFERVRRAQEVCRTCPVLVECLRWALMNCATGVYGGQHVVGGVIPPPRVLRERHKAALARAS